jgi:hypothetical protein
MEAVETSIMPEPDKPVKGKPRAKREAKAKPPPLPSWDYSMRPPALPTEQPSCRILSWNVAGLRALLRKVKEAEAGTREEHIPSPIALADAEQADIVCLQV